MPARGAVQIAAAVLAAAALGACTSGSSGPVALPSLSDSGRVSPTGGSATAAGPSNSTLGDSTASRPLVERAIQDYFSALNRAVGTGRTESLQAITTAECTCIAIVDEIKRVYTSGRIVGGAWTLKRVQVDLIQKDVAGAAISFTVDPYVTQDAAGNQTGRFDGHAIEGRVSLRLVNGAWMISDVDRKSEQGS